MTDTPRSTNVTWHHGDVTPQMRADLHGHRGVTVWFTGLSGSGKSTLSRAVELALHERGVHTYVLDGDNVRHGLNGDLGFTAEDRTENIRRVGEVARLFVDAGLVVLSAFISPYRADRQRARGLHPEGAFVEVFVNADLAVCESRDPKGLYARARSGEISNFTGVTAPYEAPEAPEVEVDTGEMDVAACVAAVVGFLEEGGWIEAPAVARRPPGE